MALPSSGQISFGALADNRDSASRANVAMSAYAQVFASGSLVGDVDGNSTANQTADRNALNSAPYSLSEFYAAEYVNEFYDTVVAQLADGTVVTSNGYVDGESARISFDVNNAALGNSYTAGLKLASDGSVVVSATETESGTGVKTIAFTAPSRDAATDVYYPFVTTGTYENAVGGNINHYDQLAGGATGRSYSSANVDASDESVSNVTITPSVSTGIQTGYSISPSSITAGDGGTMTATDTGAGNVFSISNTPGVVRFTTTHNGNPSSARNNTSSTGDVTISYNRAIDGVASSDHTVNSGVSFIITAISEGITSSTVMRMGYGASAGNTTYSGTSDKTISTSQFVRSTQTQAFTYTLTSGTSLVTLYPKAHYTSGTATLTAGSAIYIAPLFSYSTTGDQTIDVNQTQAMAASSVVGNSANVAIASSPSSQTGNNSVTFTPSTNNGEYTISYTGTANYSQTSNTTDTLTVRPICTLSRSTATVYGFGSYATNTTPTGVSTTNVVVTATPTGTVSTYTWTKPTGTTVSGGGSGDPTVTMNFSGASGTKSFSATVNGRAVGSVNTTSTSDSIDVAYVAYTQQSISSVTPNSGDYRRGATTINVAWTSINVALVDIHLVAGSSGTSTTAQTTDNDSLDSANTSEAQTYSATIVDVGRTNVGTYTVRVQDASDDVPTTSAVSVISVLDTAPTTPGAFQDSAGGHNGSLAMDWAASSYAYHYQIYKSAGDSDASYSQLGSNQASNSKTISETSGTVTNGPFYYKVRALNFAQGGVISTEYSSYNTARRFIIYPTLDADNNIPQPATSIIYSTVQQSDTSTYPPSTVMNVTTDSDNVTGYSWATSLTTGASITDAAVQNPTISTGVGVGTISTQLTVSGNSSQTYVHSADNITVNYEPRVYNITYSTSADPFIANNSTVSLTALQWQGHDVQSGYGFSVGVFAAATGGSAINSSGSILRGSPLTDGILDGNTGGAQVGTQPGGAGYCQWAGTLTLGTISSTGTVYVRVTDLSPSNMPVYSETLSVASWNNVSVTSDNGSGFASGEDATELTGGDFSTDVKSYLGTLQNGSTLYNDANGTGGVFNGGGDWHNDDTNNYVMTVTTGGVVGSYTADANITPKAPTGVSAGSATTSTITLNWTNASAIDEEIWIYYVKNGSNSADSGDTSWGENPLSTSLTTDIITGLDGDSDYSFVVYAKRGTSLSEAGGGNRDTLSTIADRTLATNDSASALDTWNNETNTYKYGDVFVLTLSDTVLNDQLIVTITHSGDTLSDITTKLAMNKDNNNNPYNSDGATPDGTGVQETGAISSGTPRTLTFSSLDSGTRYFTGKIEGLSDGTVNAGGVETATFTVTAVVKDSGGSTVVASATYHTYQQRFNPFT